ncbi:Probable thioredoxin-2 [Galdieria sulphuraria]|nr:Probable thioredoxin-2 [Galdieria sulphuraria]
MSVMYKTCQLSLFRYARRFVSYTKVTSDTEFEKVMEASNQKPQVVYCHAEWCGPCRQLGPLLERLMEETQGKIELAKVDVDRASSVADRLQVAAVPTVFCYHKGKQKDQFVGALGENQVKQFLQKAVQMNE